MESPHNDTYLADWLAGKISDQQLIQLIGKEEFDSYARLRDDLSRFQAVAPDMDRNYAAIKEKIARGSIVKSRPSNYIMYVGIAAVFIVLFGLFGVAMKLDGSSTEIGDNATVSFADRSLVRLNSDSKISFPWLFTFNRKIELTGEAYFEVTKGREFVVSTESGTVKVLGTKFNVSSREGFFTVDCYHGKVNVFSGGNSRILKAGESIRFFGGEPELSQIPSDSSPGWMSGEAQFKNAPFGQVMLDLQSHYNYKVIYPSEYESVRFTGNFPHNDIEVALKSVCIPLGLKYSIQNELITISR